ESTTCGATLDPSSSCTVNVAFAPTGSGARSANFVFNDSAANSPQSVTLSGTGVASNASVTPGAVTFAAVTLGSTSSPQSVTLSNGGTAAINISSIAVSGANASDFNLSAKTCGASLAGSGSCTVSITFAPSATGSRAAT